MVTQLFFGSPSAMGAMVKSALGERPGTWACLDPSLEVCYHGGVACQKKEPASSQSWMQAAGKTTGRFPSRCYTDALLHFQACESFTSHTGVPDCSIVWGICSFCFTLT